MTLVFLLVGVAVVVAVALLAVGRLGELPEVEPDRAPLALPDDRLVASEDVDNVRFAVGMRGYRMDEVDDVLDRLAADVAERDARIAELESQVTVGSPTDPFEAPVPVEAAEAPVASVAPETAAVEDEPRA